MTAPICLTLYQFWCKINHFETNVERQLQGKQIGFVKTQSHVSFLFYQTNSLVENTTLRKIQLSQPFLI
jgi:hypothetical protein